MWYKCINKYCIKYYKRNPVCYITGELIMLTNMINVSTIIDIEPNKVIMIPNKVIGLSLITQTTGTHFYEISQNFNILSKYHYQI